jgi:hypothetical protein
MSNLKNNARPGAWEHRGRATRAGDAENVRRSDSSTAIEVAIAVGKRGKDCIICKLVKAQPLRRLVLAMPYRHRQTVDIVSLPPSVLAYGRRAGAAWWVVRLDTEGRCLGLPLAQVEMEGWLKPSQGNPEWFVPLTSFRSIPWQEWAYCKDIVHLGDDSPSRPTQATLWETG